MEFGGLLGGGGAVARAAGDAGGFRALFDFDGVRLRRGRQHRPGRLVTGKVYLPQTDVTLPGPPPYIDVAIGKGEARYALRWDGTEADMLRKRQTATR
ncbi:hypothetical protein [Streptomyces sp. AM6-12]|uniref:hypothetical protein n=1 Tax=Streptomyces sp. AM6-12 TaxID=3345149 RepID=UPI00378FBF39